MLENIDESIDRNLKLVFESNNHSIFRHEFVDEKGRRLKQPARFSDLLESKGLIDVEASQRKRCDLTEFGFKVSEMGGWLEYLRAKVEHDNQIETQNREKEDLELNLAKSNLEANKLNKKIAKRNEKNERKNMITTWINIGIGIINVGLLVWQILKA